MSTIFPSDSTDSTSKRTNRALYVLTFIEFTFVFICLLLLLLNQCLNVVVDDYSPAYSTNNNDEPIETSTAHETTTHETTTHETTTHETTTHETTTHETTTHETTTHKTTTHETTTHKTTTHETTTHKTTTTNSTFKRDVARKGWLELFNYPLILNDSDNNDKKDESDLKTKISRRLDKPMIESAIENPLYRSKTTINSKQKEAWTNFFSRSLSQKVRVKRGGKVFLEEQETKNTKTKLTNLLIMYPCCVSTIIILLMQLISRFSNDPMYRSTMLILLSISTGIGATIFALSLIESINHENIITTLIAVSSAIFIVLEIVDLILIFVSL